ncbi:response regulator [Swingsia samuiensis]|uniref:Response regulator n=1 Tax=Swingsia samuiensis TaxID=1293412 RepID=A0A4Y6UIV8_9PROT|nr:response regulator [Swingsia samuiensis]QDH16311.1 response regulator [Swingsia samuiensis]
METKQSVLLIDDNNEFRSAIAQYLLLNGLQVFSASGLEDLEGIDPDWSQWIIVLDLQLGTVNGIDVMRFLREKTDAPIILMTGHHVSEMDRVIGLELGADDYLIKPFGPRELLARIRALGRRYEKFCQAKEEKEQIQKSIPDEKYSEDTSVNRIYRFGKWELDKRSRVLKDPSGRVVKLTKGDFTLLVAFLNAPGRPLSREYLLNATRIHEDVYDRSVDVQILRLRRRFDRGSVNGLRGRDIIRTDRGLGYVFTLDVVS